MDHDEYYYQMSTFLSEKGLWEKFKDYLRSKDWTEDEIEEMEDG